MHVLIVAHFCIHLCNTHHTLLLLLKGNKYSYFCSNSQVKCQIRSQYFSITLVNFHALYSSQHYYGPGSSATLPNNLQRAASTSQVPDASYPTHYHTLKPRTKPTSTSDLSTLSPNGPFFMPSATRRQRRASLVSDQHYVQWFISNDTNVLTTV